MSDDAKYKSLFSHPRVRRDLLRGFVSKGLTSLLDLDTLQMMPTEFVDARLGAQRSDMVWRVNYRKEISEGELYVVVLTEFQSTVDRDMPLRMVKYTAQIYTKLLEEKRSPGQKLPPVLPVVVYSGEAPWSAPEEMEEMIAPVGEELMPFLLRQRYFLLDLHRVGVDDALLDNVLYVQALIEQGRWEDLWPALSRLQDAIDPKAEEALLDLIMELAQRAAEGSGVVDDKALAQLETHRTKGELGAMGSLLAQRMDEAIDVSRVRGLAEGKALGVAEGKALGVAEGKALGVAEGKEQGVAEGKALGVAEGKEQGLAEGKEQGLAEGKEQQRTMLLRLVSRKFDADTAARFEALLEAVDDPGHLAGIVDHVIDSDDGNELLSRVTGAAELH